MNKYVELLEQAAERIDVAGVGPNEYEFADELRAAAAEIKREEFDKRRYIVLAPSQDGPSDVFVDIEDPRGKSVRIPSETIDGGLYRRIGPLYPAPVASVVPEGWREALQEIRDGVCPGGEGVGRENERAVAEVYLQAVEDALSDLEQTPAAPPEISEDSPCTDADGCPTETAALKRFWRECQKAETYGWIWIDDDYPHETRHLIVGERPDDSPEWQAVYREPIPAAPVVQEGLTRLVAEWREMHNFLCGPDDDPTDRMVGHAYGQCANDLENLLSTFPEPEKHNADSGEMRLTVSYLSSFLNEANKSEDEDRDELLEYHLERALQWLDAAMKEAK